MKEFSKYVGLDTHKDTIAVAVTDAQGGKVRYFGEISNTPEAVAYFCNYEHRILRSVNTCTLPFSGQCVFTSSVHSGSSLACFFLIDSPSSFIL
jgi:hypothetical protein